MIPVLSFMREFSRALFYGNFFYGICAVGLATVTIHQLALEQVGIFVYLFVFCIAQAFYTWPFVHHLHSPFKSTTHTAAPLSKAQKELDDERHIWYAQHGKLMWWSSMICTLSALFIGVSFFSKNWQQIRSVPALHWCLSLSIILLSILYYYKLFGGLKKNLRSYWWAKPIIIGLAWAAISVYLPWILGQILVTGPSTQRSSIFPIWLFIDVFIYLFILALLFDIKDTKADRRFGMKTIASQIGGRSLVFNVILPTTILWLGIGLIRLYVNGASFVEGIWYAIPYLALWPTAISLITKKKLIYYLVVVDGLILVKALCGLFAV